MSKTMRAIPVVWVLFLTSCGGVVHTAAHPTPSPSGTQLPVAAASPQPLNNCRLPVAGFFDPSKSQSLNGAIETQKGTGGFINFPDATYSPAADSDTTYVAAARVWLAVPQQSISPDGKSYVDARSPRQSLEPPTTTLYLVDITAKSERLLLAAPQGDAAIVLAYTSSGIYVEVGSSTAAGKLELWRVDPATGHHEPVSGAQAKAGVTYQAWMAVNAGAAWGIVVTGDQQPSGQATPSYKLVRLNLTDGTLVEWYESPSPFGLPGFDWNDNPILMTSFGPGAAQLTEVTAPMRATPVTTSGGDYLPGRGQAVKDTHGVWFGSADGSIWLSTPDGRFTKVAAVPPQPGGTGQPFDPHAWRTIAGPCV